MVDDRKRKPGAEDLPEDIRERPTETDPNLEEPHLEEPHLEEPEGVITRTDAGLADETCVDPEVVEVDGAPHAGGGEEPIPQLGEDDPVTETFTDLRPAEEPEAPLAELGPDEPVTNTRTDVQPPSPPLSPGGEGAEVGDDAPVTHTRTDIAPPSPPLSPEIEGAKGGLSSGSAAGAEEDPHEHIPSEEPEPEAAPPVQSTAQPERPQSLLARLSGFLRRISIKPRLPSIGAILRAAAWIGTLRPRAELESDKNAKWWRRTLLETVALFAIVVPIEMAITGGRVGAFGVHPHPYWLIVLPMAAARGVVSGLIAAALASFLFALGAMQATRPEDLSQLFEFETMLEPILFFGVGFFLGEVHDELALRFRKVERLLADVQERNTALRQERDVLSDANRELERRVVDDSVQFGNLIVAATRIEHAGWSEVFEVALEMVEEHCGAAASVLLRLDDGTLDLLCSRGWKDGEQSDRLAAARRSPFVERAVAEGVAVNGFRPGEAPPERGPLVVAPLFDSSGVVKALLCLDDVPISRLNESTISTFLGIAEWISAALARLAQGRDAPDPGRSLGAEPMADIWMGSPAELGERLRLELERCARYGVPTSFLAIQARQWRDASSDGADLLDRYILTHFSGGLRPSDALYRFGYPGCYLLVLAGTTVEGAGVVRTRLLRRVDYSPRKEVGPVEIFATGPDSEAPDLVSLVDRVAARFRKVSPIALEGTCPVEVPAESRPGDINAFLRRIKLETSLAVRNGFDLHVAGIVAEAPDDMDASLLSRHVQEAGGRALRPTDGVYTVGLHHCAVVLPSTAAEEAAAVVHRLVQRVRARDAEAPYGHLSTQVVGLGPSHPDAGSFLEALARYRAREVDGC